MDKTKIIDIADIIGRPIANILHAKCLYLPKQSIVPNLSRFPILHTAQFRNNNFILKSMHRSYSILQLYSAYVWVSFNFNYLGLWLIFSPIDVNCVISKCDVRTAYHRDTRTCLRFSWKKIHGRSFSQCNRPTDNNMLYAIRKKMGEHIEDLE